MNLTDDSFLEASTSDTATAGVCILATTLLRASDRCQSNLPSVSSLFVGAMWKRIGGKTDEMSC